MHVLPYRYVFRIKTDIGPKVRIVAKVFRQIQGGGVEYYDTYDPVLRLTTARIFLDIVSYNNLWCDQMDVVTSFLNGDLHEEAYMEVTTGFQDQK